MNERLRTVAGLIQDGKGMIDVGTDHGYLPAALAAAGYSGSLFASDINAGPLESAKRTAAEAGLAGRIRFLLCDGLTLCPPNEIDAIVIAGMGGDMIVKILNDAEWCMNSRYHLILQPMTKAEVLRYWLIYNEFAIESEFIAEDSGSLYQIISARFGGSTRLSDAELFLGKRSLHADPILYSRQLEHVIARFQKAIRGMSGREGEPRLCLYRDILRQLNEMRGQK